MTSHSEASSFQGGAVAEDCNFVVRQSASSPSMDIGFWDEHLTKNSPQFQCEDGYRTEPCKMDTFLFDWNAGWILHVKNMCVYIYIYPHFSASRRSGHLSEKMLPNLLSQRRSWAEKLLNSSTVCIAASFFGEIHVGRNSETFKSLFATTC